MKLYFVCGRISLEYCLFFCHFVLDFLSSKMVNCVACKCWVEGGIEAFKTHLKAVPHSAPFICYEGDCFTLRGRSYDVKSSFIRHLYDHHNCLNHVSSDGSSGSESGSESETGREDDDGSDFIGGCAAPGRAVHEEEEDSMDCEENEDEENDDDFEDRMEHVAALLLLNISKKGNVVGTAIELLIDDTVLMMRQIVTATLGEVVKRLKRDNVGNDNIYEKIKSIKFQDPFKQLRDPEIRLKVFAQKFNMILPEPKFIDYRWDERVDRRTRLTIPVQLPMYFQYISLQETLVAVLNHPVWYDLIHQERRSSDGRIRSYLDGEVARKHPLISKYPHTLRLVKWMDDSEVVNAQGSKTSIHKIVSDCFQIQNLPQEENARLRSIFLSSYSYREDLPPEEKIDILLEPFQKELEKLESEEGVIVDVRGEPYRLRATVVAGAADTLAGHEMCGLASSSANRFCSQCLITRHEFRENILAMGVPRTRDVHMQNIEELQSRGEKFAMTSSGVNRLSRLCKSKFADFPEAMIKDPMHDILRGIAPMELKLVLNHYINVSKLFDVHDFNARMKSFNYGCGDLKNKPSPNFTKDSFKQPLSYTLHQTASQTWCLLRVFPFLVDNLVPENDHHLNLIVLLKRMSDIIFSLDISESDIDLLESLIEEHHMLFEFLFPPPSPSAPQAVPENDCDDVDDGADEDFLEEPQEDEENIDDPPQVEQPSSEAGPSSNNGKSQRKKRRLKVVRAIQKHHHVRHTARSIRKYGPIALYSTMR